MSDIEQKAPAGWYPSGQGQETYWDGDGWQLHTARPIGGHPVPASQHVSQQSVKQARDRAVYTREQHGHSLILNLLIVGPLTLWITTIYWSVSPRHFWHA